MMKRWIMLGALALWLPTMASAQQLVGKKNLVLRLDLTAKGQVSAVKLMGPARYGPDSRCTKPSCKKVLPKALVHAVDRIASSWRFKTPVKDGKSAFGRTYALTTMKVIKKADGNYRVQLGYHYNGPLMGLMLPPRYPARMRNERAGAGVVADARIEPDGSISRVRIVKVFTRARDRGKAFAEAVKNCIRKWKAHPVQVDGHGIVSHVRIPMFFHMGSTVQGDSHYKQQVMSVMHSGAAAGKTRKPIPGISMQMLDSPFVKQSSI